MGIGMKVRFIPCCAINDKGPKESVTGKIVYINHEHKFFVAEYDCCGNKQRESFKFSDVGQEVTVYG